jgi:hypothetical protein
MSKIAIFGVLSALLIAAIYSSSVAFGATVCFKPKGQDKTTFCTSNISEKWYECTLGADGIRHCKEIPNTLTFTDDSMPPDLKNALDIAVQESQNTTKVPKTGILDEPGALSDDGSTDNDESTENGDDTEVPNGLGGLNDGDDAPTINPGQ